MDVVRVNREQRRFLEAILRDDYEAGWFEVRGIHFEASTDGIEVGVVCETHDVTFRLSYPNLLHIQSRLDPDPDLLPNTVLNLTEHNWRWSSKRKGFYPEVNLCRFCEHVHVPILTASSIDLILAEAREQGFLAHEPTESPGSPTLEASPESGPK
jgi:hypothetical protein